MLHINQSQLKKKKFPKENYSRILTEKSERQSLLSERCNTKPVQQLIMWKGINGLVGKKSDGVKRIINHGVICEDLICAQNREQLAV